MHIQELEKRGIYGLEANIYSDLLGKFNKATITPDELAGEFGSHGVRVRKLCVDGTIKAVKIGHRWHIPLASAAQFLAGGAEHD